MPFTIFLIVFLHSSSLLSESDIDLSCARASEYVVFGRTILKALFWRRSTKSDRYCGRLLCHTGNNTPGQSERIICILITMNLENLSAFNNFT